MIHLASYIVVFLYAFIFAYMRKSSHQSLNHRNIELEKVVAELTQAKEDLISSKLAADLDGVPERLLADERKIKQVLYNLLSNAVKFTPVGGEVRLAAAVQDAAQLRGCPISTERHSQWLCVWVTETGIGLDPQDPARVFKPFEQVESSLSRKFQGTGLGLALTRKMVELHSGAIWVESAGPGKGSTFRFTMPVRTAPDTKAVTG